MDLTFLQRLGKALQNAHTMLRSRGLSQTSGLVLPDEPLAIAGLLYTKAKELKCSLGHAARSTWTSGPTGPSTGLWVIDRNFDVAKSRERMTSTDQVKALQECLSEASYDTNIVLVPMKLSPQAKKENLHADVFLFDDLLIDLTKHEWSIPHVPVSLAEARMVLGAALEPSDLPVLPLADPMARWYGLCAGTIVRIDNPTIVSYRVVA